VSDDGVADLGLHGSRAAAATSAALLLMLTPLSSSRTARQVGRTVAAATDIL